MRRLSAVVEELMGAAPAAPAGQAPGMMGPSKPKIALKGQAGAGGAPAGNMPADPKAAGAQLAAALAQAGGAIQNTVDAGVNQANMRQGNPDANVQGAQPQPARTTPQQRMQQQKDELALKRGTLPNDLTDDVARVAQQQKPGMPQKPGIPNQRQPGGAPMESVTEDKKMSKEFKIDGKMSNPDDTNGFDKVTAAQAKATAKHKAAIKGDAKLGGSTLSKESGRGSQWQAVRAGKLKSVMAVKEGKNECQRCGGTIANGHCDDQTCPFSDHKQSCPAGMSGHPEAKNKNAKCTCGGRKQVQETDVLGDEGRKAILDEFFA